MPGAAPPPTLRKELLALRPTILAWAKSWVSGKELEDVAQKVLEEADRNLPTFDPSRCTLRQWVYVITARKAISHLRSDRVLRLCDDESAAEATPSTEPSPEALLLRAEKLQIIDKAIGDMDPRLLSVLIARHVEDRSHEEIAKEFGIPVATSRSRARRARDEAMARLLPWRQDLRGSFVLALAQLLDGLGAAREADALEPLHDTSDTEDSALRLPAAAPPTLEPSATKVFTRRNLAVLLPALLLFGLSIVTLVRVTPARPLDAFGASGIALEFSPLSARMVTRLECEPAPTITPPPAVAPLDAEPAPKPRGLPRASAKQAGRKDDASRLAAAKKAAQAAVLKLDFSPSGAQ